jgi:predicted NBD/HSP70 family sugar kinase
VGLALGGTLYRGPTNGAGEWGHTLLVLDGRACRCGRSGCIEAYIGARGIMQTLREVDPDSPMLHDDDQTRTVLALAEGLDRADAVALAVVSRTGDYLGAGLADLLNLVNPEAVVVCGWVADILGVALLDRAREVAGRAALPTTFSAARIDLSVIDRNQVTLGAALLALEGFLRGLGPPPGRPGRPRAASGRPSTP